MNPEAKTIIEQFITLPLVLKVFKRDQKYFTNFKMKNVYLDKLDAAIEATQSDLNRVKQDLYMNHHIRVTKMKSEQGRTSYQWKGPRDEGVLTYSSEELRSMTETAMEYYLLNSMAQPTNPEERTWYD